MAARQLLHLKARLGEVPHVKVRDEIQIPGGKDSILLSHPHLDGGPAYKHRLCLEQLEGIQQGFRDSDRTRRIVPTRFGHFVFLAGGRLRAPPSRTLLSLS